MKKILSPKGITCIAAVFIVILGLVIGSFSDLNISKALAIREVDGKLVLANHPVSSIILNDLSYFGETVLFGFASAVIVLNLVRKKSKMTVLDKILSICFFIGIVGLMAFFAYKSMKIISVTSFGFWHYLMIVLITFVMTFLIWYVAVNLKPAIIKKSFIPSIFTVITVAASNIFVEAAKFIWGRIRPRDLVELGSLDNYVNWYQVSGHTGYDSFPSSHALQAMLLLLIIIWMAELGARRKTKKITTIGILCWTALIMFSRVLAGAHFVSDVTAGFAVGFAFIYIAFVMYERKMGKHLYDDNRLE